MPCEPFGRCDSAMARSMLWPGSPAGLLPRISYMSFFVFVEEVVRTIKKLTTEKKS